MSPLTAARAAQRAPLLSVDLVFRRHDYRLAEPERADGHARVTFVSLRSMPFECSQCHHAFRSGSRLVLFGVFASHPGCAIKAGQLEHMARCQEQDDIDAALAARADAEQDAARRERVS